MVAYYLRAYVCIMNDVFQENNQSINFVVHQKKKILLRLYYCVLKLYLYLYKSEFYFLIFNKRGERKLTKNRIVFLLKIIMLHITTKDIIIAHKLTYF